jgi:raffinose/stachyose/melibiose transport system permease protein
MTTATQKPVKASKIELKKKTPASWFIYFALLLLVIVWLFPFWMAVVNALKTQADFVQTGPLSLPKHPSLSHITKFWNDVNFSKKLMNSIIVSIAAPLITILLSFFSAYAIGIGKVKGRTAFLSLFMVALTIPQEALIYPLYKAAKTVHLYDNLLSIIIIFGVLQMAFSTYLLSSVMSEFPEEILEAAKIDGASSFMLLRRIIFPLLMPTMLVLATFLFIWDWNEFLIPLVLLPSNDNQTVALSMAYTTGQWTSDPTARAAAALLGALPSILFFLVFQRTLMRGVTMGAVK